MKKKHLYISLWTSISSVALILGIAASSRGDKSSIIAKGGGEYNCALPNDYHELSDILSIAINSNSETSNPYRVRGTVTRSVGNTTYIQRVNQNNKELDSIVLKNCGTTYTPGNVLDISGGTLSNTNDVPYLNASTATINVSYSNNPTGYAPLEFDNVQSFINNAFTQDSCPYSHFVKLNNVKVAFETGSDALTYIADASNETYRFYAEAATSEIKSLLDSHYLSEATLSLTGLLSKNGSDETLKIVQTSDIVQTSSTLRNPQDTTILQAWNWSIQSIRENLDNIKNAGFKTIQISPLQPQKDKQNGTWTDQWWKLYQPLGFKISTSSNENVLGTKSELMSLTSEAKTRGINIIVDVVANHLAGNNYNTFAYGVSNYESDIVNNNRIHGVNKSPSDSDYESIVRGHLGDYPDLKTEDVNVQNRVISLLKEYIDVGVAGFRFDAAKHIETPNDTQYSSNFWSNVLNTVDSYAQETKGFTPYRYGEVLGVGNNRQMSWYTPYMSVSDSATRNYRNAIVNHDVNGFNSSYAYNVDSNKAVLWPESHDDYKSEFEGNHLTDQALINKAYAITASREGAASLYLARPYYGYTQMGNVGSTSYKEDILVPASNKFHNELINASEYIKRDNGYFVNVRKGGERNGIMIVNVNGSESGSINVNVSSNFMVPDGKYIDLTSNKEVTVSGGYVTADFGSDGAMVLLGIFKNEIAINEGYGIKLNGRPIVATPMDEKDYGGRDQYKIIRQTFRTGDTFSLYNFENQDTWVIDVDPYSFSSNPNAYISKGTNTYTVLQDFTADIYIKLKYQDDQIYFDLAGMSVSESDVTLHPSDSHDITVRNYAGDYTATSSNTSVATVNKNGGTLTINAVAVGNATITVSDGVVTRYITVVVENQLAILTYTFTDLPSWVVNDVDLFAFIKDANDNWIWVSATGSGTTMSFEAEDGVKQIVLVRCVKGTTTPSWEATGNNLGRIYNQTKDDIITTTGVYTYSAPNWKDYNPS